MPRRISAIVLAGALMCASAHAATIKVTIENLVSTPADAQAKVGDTIEWINKDVVAHTATARDGTFDVLIGPNKTARTTLKKAGSFDYYCKFHPNMKARVTVAP